MGDRRAEPGVILDALTVEELLAKASMDELPDLRLLFHRLNNQLGVILAHAELLESKAPDEASRTRASQIVSSTLEAMTTAREVRSLQNRNPHSDL
jgi:hypothetical protein